MRGTKSRIIHAKAHADGPCGRSPGPASKKYVQLLPLPSDVHDWVVLVNAKLEDRRRPMVEGYCWRKLEHMHAQDQGHRQWST